MAALRKGGAVADNSRVELVRNLGAVYNDAWENEALMNRLVSEPRTVLAEHGIELPATVEVEAEPTDPAKEAPDAPRGTLADILARWDRMVEKGRVILIVPPSRPAGVGTRDLTDEDLERVSGGAGEPQTGEFLAWLSMASSGFND